VPNCYSKPSFWRTTFTKDKATGKMVHSLARLIGCTFQTRGSQRTMHKAGTGGRSNRWDGCAVNLREVCAEFRVP